VSKLIVTGGGGACEYLADLDDMQPCEHDDCTSQEPVPFRYIDATCAPVTVGYGYLCDEHFDAELTKGQ
jgi:hypothetical protein